MSESNQQASAEKGAFQTAVQSPCINICDLDDDSICVGCYRAIEEIAGWGMLDNVEKRDVLELAKKRREAAE
ncbi:hypothetical protein GCM10009133_12180 [Cocleimonas flava]|uniref:Fe-S protein YdhL (DUF1289 family) n=1 Tax=Cocleimonas flava TaxID=634765 RepID=A0A4R1F168_9GAMM|nr:DUF1289 domain-containing protein [Cocleimonas flava]TCJ87583.1 hypothetical protein EV695_2095 [Cocleimonas flava]